MILFSFFSEIFRNPSPQFRRRPSAFEFGHHLPRSGQMGLGKEDVSKVWLDRTGEFSVKGQLQEIGASGRKETEE